MSKELPEQRAEKKILSNNIDSLTEKELDMFIEAHWLEFTCRYKLSPCGDLTLFGKKQYFNDNIEEIQDLIKEFPLEIEA